jgi:hypothetical protein
MNLRRTVQAVKGIFTNLVTAVTRFVRQESRAFPEACIFGHFCSFFIREGSGTHFAKA